MELYGTSEPLEMEVLPRKIPLPEQMEERECFAVRRSDIDTNEHVNNCRYVQMAQEVLEEEIEVKHLRVEYKIQRDMGTRLFRRSEETEKEQ